MILILKISEFVVGKYLLGLYSVHFLRIQLFTYLSRVSSREDLSRLDFFVLFVLKSPIYTDFLQIC